MFSKKSRYYDNSSIATYKECPRKYFLRHVLGWSVDSGKEAPALVFGSSWHAGLDELYLAGNDATDETRLEAAVHGFQKEWQERGYEADPSMEDLEQLNPRIPGVAFEMYMNYIKQRQRLLNECTVLAVEKPFAIPIPGLPDVYYVGKMDKVIEYNGIHILEHKTTSAYSIAQTFQPLYVESWGNSSQIKGYELEGQVYFPGLQDVWVDAALVHKKIHNAFKFIPIAHGDYLLKMWLNDTIRWIQEIIAEEDRYKEVGHLEPGMFRMNEDSCFGKYGKCPFIDICNTLEDPSREEQPPMGYTVNRWEPFDLLKLDQLIHSEETQNETPQS